MQRLYTLREITEVLQLSYSTTYKLVHNGTLPSTKVGGSIRISQESLRNYILNNTNGGE